MNFDEIHAIIKKLVKSGAAEVSFETKDLKLTVKNHPKFPEYSVSSPSFNTKNTNIDEKKLSNIPEQESGLQKSFDENLITIKSPMVGIFYRKPAPDKPLYVNIGDKIKKGTVLCIIEAMKLFNEIESEAEGKIVKTLVDDGTAVEYDQPLFLIDPK